MLLIAESKISQRQKLTQTANNFMNNQRTQKAIA